MIIDPIEAGDIRYNPTTACFEAKVTVHGAGPATVYACEVPGDLFQTNTDITAALHQEVRRRHFGHARLCSAQRSRAPRPAAPKYGAYPPRSWLARLPFGSDPHAV